MNPRFAPGELRIGMGLVLTDRPSPLDPSLQLGDRWITRTGPMLSELLEDDLGVRSWLDSTPGGSGIIVPDRRNHAVNAASVQDFTNPTGTSGPILRTNTAVNAVGGFNGGGTGNKALLGHWLPAPLLLIGFASLSVDYEQLTPEAGLIGNTRLYVNLLVEFDPIGNPGVLSVLVLGSTEFALNTGTFSVLGPNRYRTTWVPGANFIQVVSDKGMGPPSVGPPVPLGGPATVPVSEGPAQPAAWFTHDYSLANLLVAYPGARLVNGASGDGGMPKLTSTAGVLLVLGDSANVKQNSVRVLDWRLNGAAI